MEILKMSETHIKAVAEIERECFSSPWSENALREELGNENARFFVAENKNEILGYCGMHVIFGECYITNVAVKEKHRGQGIATALMRKLEEVMINENGDFITLEVRESNFNAISLYEKLGYKKVGTRKNFYSNPAENAILMTKQR